MAFEIETPEDMSGPKGNWLKIPGWYLFQIKRVDEVVANAPGAFGVDAVVVSGTVDGQKGKELQFTFFAPKMDEKDKGELTRRKQTRFCIATNLLPIVPQKSARYSVDLQQAVGRVFVAHVEVDEYQKGKTGKEYLRLAYDDIFHVDDPASKDVPKDAALLSIIPPTLRYPASAFPQAAVASAPSPAPQQSSPPQGATANLDTI